MAPLSPAQLTGREESHLVELAAGHRLQAPAAAAFDRLHQDARAAGFELAVASSFRSYTRQLAIWNGKARGLRPVHDDNGQPLDMAALSPVQRLHAILRYSAIPGTSRHHWGTDLDVYDAAVVPAGYTLRLAPSEVAPGGMFDALHRWLDGAMAAGESHGFYRPYTTDSGGVAPERWHLSYAPLALDCARRLDADLLLACWDGCPAGEEPLQLAGEIRDDLQRILARYVTVASGWCPPY